MARFREIMGKMQINITVTVLFAVVYFKKMSMIVNIYVLFSSQMPPQYFHLISRKHCL